MSTPRENTIFPLENILYSINSVVQKECFGDVVKRIREDNGWSLATVRKQSGNKLATSYINRIENNQVKPDVISIDKTKALAKGLKASEDYIFALARGIEPNQRAILIERFSKIVEGYERLSQEEQNNLQPLLLVLEQTIYHSKSYIQIEKKKKELIKVSNFGKVNKKEDSNSKKRIA